MGTRECENEEVSARGCKWLQEEENGAMVKKVLLDLVPFYQLLLSLVKTHAYTLVPTCVLGLLHFWSLMIVLLQPLVFMHAFMTLHCLALVPTYAHMCLCVHSCLHPCLPLQTLLVRVSLCLVMLIHLCRLAYLCKHVTGIIIKA